jgi:hypothetical protein
MPSKNWQKSGEGRGIGIQGAPPPVPRFGFNPHRSTSSIVRSDHHAVPLLLECPGVSNPCCHKLEEIRIK